MQLALNRSYAFGLLALLVLAIVAAAVMIGAPTSQVTEVGAASSDFAGAHGSAECVYYGSFYGWQCFG